MLVPLDLAYSRAVARGAARFARTIPGLLTSIDTVVDHLDLIVSKADGPVIAMLPAVSRQRTVLNLPWPVVNISAAKAESAIPMVVADNRQIGRMAAEHLLAMGYRDFVMGGHGLWFSQLRMAGFSEALDERGLSCREIDGLEALERELPSLPKPIAIFADTDRRARLVIDICRGLSLHVPGDVAVVGVDNDALLCEEMVPQLTSVDPNGVGVGFEAARLAFDLIAGKPAPAGPILVAPTGVVARESTSALAVRSPELARAVAIIRDRVGGGLTVNRVAAAARVPRRTLHRLCQEHLDMSVGELIRRQRIEKAKQLLVETDRTTVDIGEVCGFSNWGRFYLVFRRLTGVTPGAYRLQRRLR